MRGPAHQLLAGWGRRISQWVSSSSGPLRGVKLPADASAAAPPPAPPKTLLRASGSTPRCELRVGGSAPAPPIARDTADPDTDAGIRAQTPAVSSRAVSDEAIDITFNFRSDTPPERIRTPIARHCGGITSSSGASRCQAAHVSNLDASRRAHICTTPPSAASSVVERAVIPTFKWLQLVIDQVEDAEIDAFNRIGYTIGGMMVFPGYQVDRKMTINQARGCTADQGPVRSDAGVHPASLPAEDGPLSATGRHARYADFFALFGDFAGIRRLLPPAGLG